jgi:hypothetical protein
MQLVQVPKLLPTGFDFTALVAEVAAADLAWTRHYSEYQSGAWWTCTLLGRSADARDGAVTDTPTPSVTDALEQLPITREFLSGMRLCYMMARLARLDPGGALWEHKDYQDLLAVPRLRLHLPIHTNARALLVSGGRAFHMEAGSLYVFRPVDGHGACNFGDHARTHLILDVYEDAHMKDAMAQPAASCSAALPVLSAGSLADRVRNLRMAHPHQAVTADDPACTRPDTLTDWERAVLGLYFEFAVGDGQLYAQLEQVCLENGDPARARFWAQRRRLVLGEGVHA